jgi:WS/DGAT/MGAT family acyltransferase
MERLTTLDGGFLRAESPNAHMHVGWLALMDLPAGHGALDHGRLRAAIAGRLHLVPRFRQVVAGVSLGIGEPVWADCQDFDLDRHLRVRDAGRIVTEAEVHEICGTVLSRQLDRAHPLWEIVVIPRVERGRAALIGKVHHAMVDGIAAVELGALLFDLDPGAAPQPAQPWSPEPPVGDLRLAATTIADSAVEQFRAVRGAARMGMTPRSTARVADSMRRAAMSLVEQTITPAADSHLNASIGPRRELHVRRLELRRFDAIKRAAEVKLNDVVLAVVSGALRRFARLDGRRPERLRVMVPVSVRDAGAAGDGGNRISFGFVDLPVDVPRPADRLAMVHAEMQELKRSGRVGGTELLMRGLAPLPGPLKDRAVKLSSSPRLYNLTVSNVPGPRVPLYIAGSHVREIHPVIPIPEGHALSLGVLTYDGAIHIAAYADPEALPSAGALPDLIGVATRELERAIVPAARRDIGGRGLRARRPDGAQRSMRAL